MTTSWDQTARIWRVIDGTSLRKLKGHEKGLSKAIFSPNGQFILTASWDRTARLWKIDSETPFNILKGHQKGISYATFSPNSKNVITTGKVARLWDVSSGKVKGVLEGHGDWLSYATFNPDGRYVLTVSTGKTVHLWPVFRTIQEIIDYAKKRVPRCLTIEQRRQFSLPETKSQILVSEGEELARTEHIYSAVAQFEKARLLDSQNAQFDSCFKFNPKNRAERIADQAKLAEFATGLASNLGPRRTHSLPPWCENKLNKAEKMICENPLLWEIENQHYETYYELYDGSLNSEVQDQLRTEKTKWLYQIRNPQCEQSVKFCLQVYEERIKVLNQYKTSGNQ